MAHRVIFLDRDGTINEDNGYVHREKDFVFCEKAPEGLRRLQDAGYKLAIVTNQSGIGHGLYTTRDMLELHDFMRKELKAFGVVIDVIAHCPHKRNQEVCGCRKPQTGMSQQIERYLGDIDYARSWTIGDKGADLGFGKNLGTKTALIRSAYWEEDVLANMPDMVVNSLWEFSVDITKV